MESSLSVINQLLIDSLNNILNIEQKTLKEGVFNDLTVTEMHTVEAIGMYSNKTMGEVAKKLKITVGTLTVAINSLVKKNYAIRERSDKDRRLVHLYLSKKGRLLYRIHEKFHHDMVRSLITGLSKEEEKVLITSLTHLDEFLQGIAL